MPNYPYECLKCQLSWEALTSYEDRDSEICRSCGDDATRLPAMPTPLRATLASGQKRKGWKEWREELRLKQEKLNLSKRGTNYISENSKKEEMLYLQKQINEVTKAKEKAIEHDVNHLKKGEKVL